MSKFDVIAFFAFLFVLFFSAMSCSDDRPVNLNRFDVQYIDSIFFSRRDSITKLADSLCEEQYPILLKSAMDSIKSVRLEEIESILGKE